MSDAGSSLSRKARKARKLDPATAVAHRDKGLSCAEIGRLEGVAESTVWRCLKAFHPQYTRDKQQLDDFKAGRADLLAGFGAKTISVASRILDTLDDDAVVTALTPSQKSGLLLSLNATHGTAFDKERLERGMSTSNQATILRIMGEAQAQMYRQSDPQASSKQSSSEAASGTDDTVPSAADEVPKK